jgi:hypothetical protein
MLAIYLIWSGYFLLICLIGIILYKVSRIRRLSDAKPGYTKSVIADIDPITAFQIVLSFALQSGYNIIDIQEDKLKVLLNKPASLMSWGFYHYIHVSSSIDVGTTIEVAIEGPIGQRGSSFWREQQKLINSIKAALIVDKPNSIII